MAAYLSALGLNCALGQGKQAVAAALFAGDTSGMRRQNGWVTEHTLTVGAVPGELPELPALPGHPPSRNNQLLLAAALEIESELCAAINRFGAERIGVVLGTSTSGIEEASQGSAPCLRYWPSRQTSSVTGWASAGRASAFPPPAPRVPARCSAPSACLTWACAMQ